MFRVLHCSMHCTENPIYLFPEMKLRGLCFGNNEAGAVLFLGIY
jgi:hypothetical protein